MVSSTTAIISIIPISLFSFEPYTLFSTATVLGNYNTKERCWRCELVIESRPEDRGHHRYYHSNLDQRLHLDLEPSYSHYGRWPD